MPSLYQAQLRHAQHYANVLYSANLLYDSSPQSGLSWFRLERPNIQAGQQWSEEHALDESAGRLCFTYPLAGSALLDKHQHPQQRLKWLEAALTVLPRYPGEVDESALLILMGRAHLTLGNTETARDLYQRSLDKAREIGNRSGEGYALGNLGVASFYLGETSLAINCYEQSLIILQDLGNRPAEAQTRGDLGNVYFQLGEHARAIELFQERLTIARELKDPQNEIGALLSLGLGLSASGRFRDAVRSHEEALYLTRQIGDIQAEGEVLANLANTYAVLGETERSLQTSERRLEIARETGDRRGEGKTLFNQGVIFRELGKDDQAIFHGEAGLGILEGMGDPYADRMRQQITEWKTGPKKETVNVPHEDSISLRLSKAAADYQLRVAKWKSLPWWRRLFRKRPEFSSNLERDDLRGSIRKL